LVHVAARTLSGLFVAPKKANFWFQQANFLLLFAAVNAPSLPPFLACPSCRQCGVPFEGERLLNYLWCEMCGHVWKLRLDLTSISSAPLAASAPG
jgi:hypothetical protein